MKQKISRAQAKLALEQLIGSATSYGRGSPLQIQRDLLIQYFQQDEEPRIVKIAAGPTGLVALAADGSLWILEKKGWKQLPSPFDATQEEYAL